MSGGILIMDHIVPQRPDADKQQSFTVNIAHLSSLEENIRCFSFLILKG